MKKVFIKRKAFTLVELLIVIVVIGVLAAMMMFSSTEAISSAKASNIIAGLTTFKKALTHWYIDNYDKVYKHSNGEYKLRNCGEGVDDLGDLMKSNSALVTKYIGNASSQSFSTKSNLSSQTDSGYRFEDSGKVNNRSSWFVGYVLSASDKSSGIAKKLAGRAKSLGLLANQGNDGNTNKAEITPYSGGNVVWMKVLDLE